MDEGEQFMSTKHVKEETKQKNSRSKEMNQSDKQQNASHDSKEKTDKLPRRRLIPIWLRIVLVIVLCFFAIIVGMIIGYGVLGDGAPLDVLKVDTWKHIINIVKGDV